MSHIHFLKQGELTTACQIYVPRAAVGLAWSEDDTVVDCPHCVSFMKETAELIDSKAVLDSVGKEIGRIFGLPPGFAESLEELNTLAVKHTEPEELSEHQLDTYAKLGPYERYITGILVADRDFATMNYVLNCALRDPLLPVTRYWGLLAKAVSRGFVFGRDWRILTEEIVA